MLATALLAVACTGNAKPQPKVNGIVGFDETSSANANFPIPQADPFIVCGSQTQAFGTELLTTAPNKATVRYEWGQVVPGKQMFAVGTASSTVVGHGGDLPFTHPFGDDLTSNVQLDGPYKQLAQTIGTQPTDIPAGSLHTEWPEGLLPQLSPGTIQPDFVIKDGDRVAAYGDWIIDCGHADFHSEIHPPSFSAFAHSQGSTTLAHAVFNPYIVTQLFNPNTALMTDFGNQQRFADPNTQPFPLYLYQSILRLAGVGPNGTCCADRLSAHVLVAPNLAPTSISWYVCAPPGGTGSLNVSYKFTVRLGVTIAETPNEDIGCARFTATLGPKYSPLVPLRQDCTISWATLTQQAKEAVGGELDVKAALEKQVPASLIPKVDLNPVIDCYQLPSDPPPGGGAGQKVFVSDDQPFPYYGTIEVSRKP